MLPASRLKLQIKTFDSQNNFTTTIFCPSTILIVWICWTRSPFRRRKCSTITSQNTAAISYYRKSILFLKKWNILIFKSTQGPWLFIFLMTYVHHIDTFVWVLTCHLVTSSFLSQVVLMSRDQVAEKEPIFKIIKFTQK